MLDTFDTLKLCNHFHPFNYISMERNLEARPPEPDANYTKTDNGGSEVQLNDRINP
jgi:hypothetical protein